MGLSTIGKLTTVLTIWLFMAACMPPAKPAQNLSTVPNNGTVPASNGVTTPQQASTGARVPVGFDPEQTVVQLQPLIEDLDRPLFVTHAGDNSGRLFIVEKGGTLRIYNAGELLATPFLDITDRVNSNGNEQGLLGLAFAPDYATSGNLFVNYTDENGDTVIARFQVTSEDPNLADPATEFVVLQIDQPAANHNGGMLAFGPDGYLYIGMGDGGGGGDRYGNGQNPGTLLGKMLRIDVTSDLAQPYTIPADNPWVENDWNGADVRDEIWALGMRNPWRFSFDRSSGGLWIGDVGQNQVEEINFTPAGDSGLNYGWPILEGTHCYNASTCDAAGLTLPVAEYEHTEGCSVTGGYVYRGAQIAALDGLYFYADYCTGSLWATWPSASDAWSTAKLLDTGQTVSSFGEDQAGELYVTDLSAGTVAQVEVVSGE